MAHPTKIAERFYARFEGLNRAHGRWHKNDREREDGKKQGRAEVVHIGATPLLWKQHLDGEAGIGIFPLREDGTCIWGCIDIDIYEGLNLHSLEKQIEKLRLPLIVCRSKSGGAHVFLFTSEPVDAKLLRAKLMEWAVVLGYSGVEVFPKQTRLANDNDTGNWLNMPYFEHRRTVRYAIKETKSQDAEAFLAFAEARAVSAEELANLLVDDPFADLPPCLRSIIRNGVSDGTRNTTLHQCARHLKQRNPDDWQTRLEEINATFSPPLQDKEVKNTIIKSVSRKNYAVKCSDPLLKSHCMRDACEYGTAVEWPTFVNILEGDDQVPPFPLDFLPGEFRTFVEDVADGMPCPADYVAIPLLVEAGALLGRSVTVQPKQQDTSWTERPCLWGLVLGAPGTKKTPAASKALAPIRSLQHELYEAWKEEHEAWVQSLKDDDAEADPEPKLSHVLVQDATVEKLVYTMAENSDDSLLLYRDELSGWLLAMNKYRKTGGDDRQFFLETWSGGIFKVDRKTSGSLVVDDLFLGIFGGMQPEVVKQVLAGGDTDGMTQRFGLIVWPKSVDVGFVDRSPDDEVRETVSDFLKSFRSCGGTGLRFSAEATAVFGEWQTRLERRHYEDSLAAHVAKYPGLFARLSIVHWMMRSRAVDGFSIDSTVDAETAVAVRDFIDEYLKPHAKRIYGHLDAHSARAGAVRIAKWIVAEGKDDFRFSEVRQKGWREFKERYDLANALGYLEDFGWGRRIEEQAGPRGGRPSDRFQVNPEVSKVFRAHE